MFYQLKIKEITPETNDTVSVLFDIPSAIQQNFKLIAGQYITIKATINHKEVRRAYSLCSSPNSNEIKVAIKAVENGVFSNYAINQLKKGDVLEVSKPEGKFVLQPQPHKNYIAFAAGSGITPILSMVKSTLESESTATFTLIYGNKTVTDIIFYDELNNLKKKYPSQLNIHYVLSREEKENILFGKINSEITNYFIKDVYQNIVFSDAFLCGPEPMIHTVIATLKENNFSEENIHFELFTTSANQENTAQIKNGQTEVQIILDDEEVTFTMQQTDTILAASLRNKIDAPYSCQGGVCSSCIAKIKEGKAIMSKNSVLNDDEIKEGYVLTCIAHPETTTLVVDFDDI